MTLHRSSLIALEPELQAAIARERSHNRVAGPQLSQLDRQKQAAPNLHHNRDEIANDWKR